MHGSARLSPDLGRMWLIFVFVIFKTKVSRSKSKLKNFYLHCTSNSMVAIDWAFGQFACSVSQTR